ncbi:ThiF family adenylyltransferase [Runella zeae]|uniref:ThiF family adenylyltransferase n=1 Tax=Runella zeae TaxID=94255 RepID=UPI00041FA15C|nr:ThiF family adenylyltransferase [Runella zeae]
MKIKLRIGGLHYEALYHHLLSGDGKESIAFALCGRYFDEEQEIFLVHKLELFPNEQCIARYPDKVIWSPVEIVDLFEECKNEGLYLLKIHCHPGGGAEFSEYDNESDWQLSETVTGWLDNDIPIISAIMLPEGDIIARLVLPSCEFLTVDSVMVAGDEIKFFSPSNYITSIDLDDIQLRTRQLFGEGTVNILRKLRIGVIGCSGTGSIVVELLSRLGVGCLVLIDPDRVEFKNLNRIPNTTYEDAEKGRYKVDVLKSAIEKQGTGITVKAVPLGLHSYEAYQEAAGCDIVFGCMDSVDGRHLLNRIATFFILPYFDIGIRLDADGKGGIDEVLGRVDYIQPGRSSLFSRERYSLERLRAADLARTDPKEYDRQVKESYIRAAKVDSPAVISVNTYFSAQAVNELLARLHPFRTEPNKQFAEITFSIAGFFLENQSEGEPDLALAKHIGRGTVSPLLLSPMLIVKPHSS